MRLMTLNVNRGGEDRMAALCALLARERPDVLVLQECVGWEADPTRLGSVAQALGIPNDARHTVLGEANVRPSGARYSIALCSRQPVVSCRVHTVGFAHCLVEAQVEGVTVLGAHLVWQDEDARLAEVAALLRLAPSGQVVLAGDLNALARTDPYPTDLSDRLARAGVHKFGLPARFDVMNRLTTAGFVDALAVKRDGPADEPCDSARREPWATAVRKQGDEVLHTRTDYVLLSAQLAPRLVSAHVVDVGAASDHHAVVAVLAWG